MKVTLITGASAGIGEAFARRLAAEKHNLLLVARSGDTLKRLCDELERDHKITAQYVAIDLMKPGADEQLFNETEKRSLEVSWLINNAGIGSSGEFAQLDLKSELDMLQLNIIALTGLTHRYLRQMKVRRNGIIVNVASMAAFQPIPYMAAYAASKAYVRSFTEAISGEAVEYNVQVMLLCPGATETKFFEAAKIDDRKAIGVTKLETPEQVVASAMDGLRKKKMTKISGFNNRMMGNIGAMIPNRVIVKMMAKRMKKN